MLLLHIPLRLPLGFLPHERCERGRFRQQGLPLPGQVVQRSDDGHGVDGGEVGVLAQSTTVTWSRLAVAAHEVGDVGW
jgi:hypothetical protein